MKSFRIILILFSLCACLYGFFRIVPDCKASDKILLCSSASRYSADHYSPHASPWETKTLGPGKRVDNGKLVDTQLPPSLPSYGDIRQEPEENYAPTLDFPQDPIAPPPSSPPGGRRIY